MKKIGILGGTFDPPHCGHLLIANEVLVNLELDEIWFMPNQEPPHKEKSDQISNEDRLNMLKLAVGDHPLFKIETIELYREGPSYTYETLKILADLHPDVHFFFIIGADMIEYLPHWHKVDELFKFATFVGVKRRGYEHETTYPVIYTEVPGFDVSSSMIRERIKAGNTIRYLVPEAVRQYLKENHLYGSE